MTTYKYLPTVNSLLPYDRLDSVNLGMLRDGFEPLLEHLFYKDFFVAGTPSGSAAHYDLTLVWYKRLALEVPGTDGLALVAFPAQDGGAGMELPIAFDYRWEILRYKPYFDGTIPADPRAWFDLLLEILGVDPLSLLFETIDILVEGDEPLKTFVETSGQGLLTLSDAPNVDTYTDLIQQIEALDMDLSQIIFEDYIDSATDKLGRITALFGVWLGTIDPSDLIDLVVPQIEFEVRRIQFALTFPRSWLKPLGKDGKVNTDPTVRSALYFDVGRFRFSSKDGLSFHQQGNFNFPKSVILDTGFTLSLQNALVDISQTANIAPADADGRPVEFVGFYAEDAALGLPPDWFEDPNGTTAEFFGSDVLVGTGGVSGVFGIRAAAATIDDPVLNFRLGGANGLAIGLRHFDMRLHQNTIKLAELSGQISIPGVVDDSGNPAALDMTATLDDKGTLHIVTTGQMYLGNGIWLYPSDNQPILSVVVEKGASTEYAFDVNALFRVPHADEAGGTRDVKVGGSLVLKQAANGAWRIDSFYAASDANGLAWKLPGDIQLTEARFAIEYERVGATGAGRFTAGAGGKVELKSGGKVAVRAKLAFNNLNDPTDITFYGVAQPTNLNLFDQVYLFEACFAITGATRPDPSGELTITGSAGLFTKNGLPPVPTTDHFHLSVNDLEGRFSFHPTGFELIIRSGALQLPENFGPDPDNPDSPRPTVSLSESSPLQLSYSAPDQVRFQGQFSFTDFGTTLPGTDDQSGLIIKLQTATLKFTDHSLPQLTQVAGFIRLPLPDNKTADVVFEDFAWALIDIPTGTIYLKDDIPLPLGGGFEFTLLSSDNPTDIATGLTISKANGKPRFLIDGAVRLTIPADMLTSDDGDQLFTEVAGNLLVTLDDMPQFTLEEIALGGNFCLGGANGIKIDDGQLQVEGMENIFRPSPANPFILTLSGEIGLPDQGISFGLEGAKFSFVGEPLPRFDLQGISFEPGTTMQAVEQLPLKISGAELEFAEQRPIPAKLAPDNIKLTISAGLEFPIPPDASFVGRVDDLCVKFDTNGLPEIELSGIGMGIEDVKAGPLMLTGMVYLGGLNDPKHNLFFAGKVGGKLNNAGVVALAAFGTQGPLGVCLDVSAGPAGIPLGPSGFLLTGVSGGVSFINSNADPCDITSYIQIGEDGRPLDNPPALSPPEAKGPGDEPVVTTPAPMPDEGEALEIPCPSVDCPPPAMNILCQSHPDTTKYPDRVIIKFSALDEAFLNQIGITRGFIEGFGLTSPQDMAARVAGTIRAEIDNLWPPVPPELEDLNNLVRQQLDNLQTTLEGIVADAASAAIGGHMSVYDAILEAAYAGVPCPDITVKLNGTFSYAGVSAFLSVTGGFMLSSTGTAGLLGSVNLLGIPVGQARGFITAFDPEGNPDLSICGDIEAAVGPLEFGKLRFAYQCPGCIMNITEAVGKFGQHLTGPFISEVVDLVANEIKDNPDYKPDKPETALALLAPEQAVAFVAQLLNLPPDKLAPADLTACLRELFENTWQSFEPEILLCGRAEPKLFGLPLGGEIVSVSAMANKTELAASFSFSPSYMIINFYWAIATAGQGLVYPIFPVMDKAAVGFGVKFPDPLDLINRGLTGQFQSPQELAAYLEEGFDHVLSNATFTMEYELSPFGLKLADAEARVIMPNLTNHPAHPNSTWKRPEDRGKNYPSRVEVATAVLEKDVLGNPLWRGTSKELAALSFRDGKSTGNLSLTKDYFPHGGILGAGKLALPKALLDAPPVELFEKILDPAAGIMERLTAAGKFVDDYLLTTENTGALAFYLPGLNPPAFTINGRDLTPLELMKLIQKQKLDVSQIAGSDLYSLEQAFLQGYMETRLLGIPISYAQVIAIPPDGQRDSEGCFEIRAGIPKGSWLKDFVDEAGLVFQIRQAPPKPIDERFRQLAEKITQKNSRNAQKLFNDFSQSLINELPKIAMEAKISNLRIPPALSKLIQVNANTSAQIYAYSLMYDPKFRGRGPVAKVRQKGGIALRANFKFGAALGLTIDIPGAELAIYPGQSGLPQLSGKFTVNEIGLPGNLPKLQKAHLEFNSDSASGQPLFFASGQLKPFTLGPFLQIKPLSSNVLKCEMLVMKGSPRALPSLALRIFPARIKHAVFGPGADIRIHGATASQPFTFSTTRAWDAAVSVKGLYFVDPADKEFLRIGTRQQSLKAQLRGTGLSSASMALNIPLNYDVTVFPGQEIEYTLKGPSPNAALRAVVHNNGRYLLDAKLPPFHLGLFTIHGVSGPQAQLAIKLNEKGVSIPSGARLTISNLTASALALQKFNIQTNGNFTAVIATGKLSMPKIFDISAGSMKLMRSGNLAQFSMNSPKLTLFPAAKYKKTLSLGKLDIASSGRFKYDSSNQVFGLPGLMSAKGRLSVGVEPNLIINPGCDEPLANGKIRGWQVKSGSWTRRASTPKAYQGGGYFAPQTGATAELFQDINVGVYSATVARGAQEFAFQGYVRSAVNSLDTARIMIEYRNKTNQQVLTKFDSVPINSNKAWKRVFDRRKAPRGTGWIRIRLIARRRSGGTNQAYFDKLHLQAIAGLPAGIQETTPLNSMPTGPYVYLSNAGVAVPPLGLTFNGGLELTDARIKAWLASKSFKKAGLFEIGSSSWNLNYEANRYLRLNVRPPSMKLLGISVVPPSVLKFNINADTSYSAAFSTRSSMSLMPGLLEIGPSSLKYNKTKTNRHQLDLTGTLKALKTLQGSWVFSKRVKLTVSDGPFEIPVPGLGARTFISLPNLLTVKTASSSSVRIGKNTRGAFYVKLQSLQINLLGYSTALHGYVYSNGILNLSWNAGKKFNLGPFQLTSNEKGSLAFNMTRRTLAIKVGAGTLKSGYVRNKKMVHGWPSDGVRIPALNFGSAGDFEINLRPFSFNGIKLSTSGRKNYIKLKRKRGVISVAIRNEVRFRGAKMSLKLDVSSSGRVSGSVWGSLRVGSLNFGSVTMSYYSSKKPYQFQTTRKLGPIRYRLKFGSGGAKIEKT